jgi:putative spermidine/putrescine transport system substrate-binding protein
MAFLLPIALVAACSSSGDDDSPDPQVSGDASDHEGAVVVAGPGGAWGDAVRAAIDAAAAEYGLEVTYHEGSTAPNLALLQAQAQAGQVEFDLLMVNDRTYTVAKAQGLVQAPNFSLVPNMSQLDEAWAIPPAVYGDPPDALRHVVISEGLGYNTEIFAERGWDPPTSWTDLHNPTYADCVILVHPSSGLSYIPMLNHTHTGDFTDYGPTLEAISAVADRVPAFTETSIEALEFLQQGVGCLAPVSQARLLEQREQGAPVEFVAPEEGAGFLSAGWVIPKDAPHPIAAHLTLNSLISAEASQRMLEEAFLPTTNTQVERPAEGAAADLPLVAEYESLGYVEILPTVYEQLDALSREWDELLSQ